MTLPSITEIFKNVVSNINYLIAAFISEILKVELPFQVLEKHWKYIPVMLIFKKTHLNFSFRKSSQEKKMKICQNLSTKQKAVKLVILHLKLLKYTTIFLQLSFASISIILLLRKFSNEIKQDSAQHYLVVMTEKLDEAIEYGKRIAVSLTDLSS